MASVRRIERKSGPRWQTYGNRDGTTVYVGTFATRAEAEAAGELFDAGKRHDHHRDGCLCEHASAVAVMGQEIARLAAENRALREELGSRGMTSAKLEIQRRIEARARGLDPDAGAQ